MATAASRVDLSVEDGLARVTLVRPEAGNAIDLAFGRELREVAAACVVDSSIGAILLTAQGPQFCVGGDVKAIAGAPDAAAHLREITDLLHPAIDLLATATPPVVAVVTGNVGGAGIGLLCCADIVIASPAAKFRLGYTAIGLSPDAGVTYHLPRMIGLRAALDVTLTNRMLGAGEAQHLGLVTSLSTYPDAAGEERARELARGARKASIRARALLRGSADQTWLGSLDEEVEALVRSASGEGREGMRAFLERRTPDFRGSRT